MLEQKVTITELKHFNSGYINQDRAVNAFTSDPALVLVSFWENCWLFAGNNHFPTHQNQLTDTDVRVGGEITLCFAESSPHLEEA